jgi:hypothetical protein
MAVNYVEETVPTAPPINANSFFLMVRSAAALAAVRLEP